MGSVCPICKRETTSDRRFCYWCNQFLLERNIPLRAAGFARRLAAFLIEAMLGWIIWAVAFGLGAGVGAGLDGSLAAVLVGLLALIGYLIWVLFLWADGRSPGKLILGMRVIDATGDRAGFWKMALREIIGKFISAIVVYLGFLSVLWDKDQQGWHDKIANTLVVVERPSRLFSLK